MCLRRLFTKKESRKIINALPVDENGYITLYKVVFADSEKQKYFPPTIFSGVSYEEGLSKARRPWWRSRSWEKAYRPRFYEQNKEQFRTAWYRHGFYFVQLKPDRSIYRRSQVIECKAKKSWITSVGMDNVDSTEQVVTFILKKAIFPAYKETEEIVNEQIT